MATFTWAVNKAVETTTPRILTSNLGDGYKQRVGDGLNTMLKTYSVEIKGVYTTVNSIVTFLKARGGYDDFDWTPPRESAGKYICPSWTRDNLGGDTDIITMTFNEVGDL